MNSKVLRSAGLAASCHPVQSSRQSRAIPQSQLTTQKLGLPAAGLTLWSYFFVPCRYFLELIAMGDSEKPKCITVYASSSDAVNQSFKDDAYALGKAIAEAGMVQCNGGGRYGLMGAATDGGLENGGTLPRAPRGSVLAHDHGCAHSYADSNLRVCIFPSRSTSLHF